MLLCQGFNVIPALLNGIPTDHAWLQASCQANVQGLTNVAMLQHGSSCAAAGATWSTACNSGINGILNQHAAKRAAGPRAACDLFSEVA